MTEAIEPLRGAGKLREYADFLTGQNRRLEEALDVTRLAAHREQAWLDARDAEFDDRWNARMNP